MNAAPLIIITECIPPSPHGKIGFVQGRHLLLDVRNMQIFFQVYLRRNPKYGKHDCWFIYY